MRAQLVTCESVGEFLEAIDTFYERYKRGRLPDSAYIFAAEPEEEIEWSCDRAAIACA